MDKIRDKEMLIQEIKNAYADGQLNQPITKHPEQAIKNLYYSARRRCGSWENALIEAGIDPSCVGFTINKKYPKMSAEDVLDAIRTRSDNGLSNMSSHVQTDNLGLFHYAKIHYGVWSAAIKASGVYPTHLPRPDDFGKYIKMAHQNGVDISASTVRYYRPQEYHAATNKHGSWDAYLKTLDIELE